MTARTYDFAAVLRDMDIEAEMQAAQAKLAEDDRAAEEIAAALETLEADALAAGVPLISAGMRAALERLAAVIRTAPHAHEQSNLLTRRAAIQAERRFAASPVAPTGFGALDHAAYMRLTGEWEQAGEEEARERAAGFPWGDAE